jgi:hypothetical protein
MYILMGYICQGWPLRESYPFFVVRIADAREVVTPPVGSRTGSNIDKAQDRDTDLEDKCNPVDHLG